MKAISSYKHQYSIKSRITALFIFFWLITFFGTITSSYFTITSILTNKTETAMQNNIHQVQLSFENTLSTLDSVTQQLSDSNIIGTFLTEYLEESQQYEKIELMHKIQDYISLVVFTNPNIGLVTYSTDNGESFIFQNYTLKEAVNINSLPQIAHYSQISYYGPHISIGSYTNRYVISAQRKLEIPNYPNACVYVETSFNFMADMLKSNFNKENAYYLITDNDNIITYSENDKYFPVGNRFLFSKNTDTSGKLNGYFWFRGISKHQGWSIVFVIAEKEFYSERSRWMLIILFLSVFFLLLGISLSGFLYRMLYRPLNIFSNEIDSIAREGAHTAIVLTNIKEYDNLLDKVQQMKERITALITQVKYEEEKRFEKEYEILRYQINPHFLTNTLNTIHWMAVSKEQYLIDEIIQSLSRLLSYNLGKREITTTLRSELSIMKDYLAIQKFRSDFTYEINCSLNENILDMPFPRFILQPLVENAIFHGLEENGKLTIHIYTEENGVRIDIIDNGIGMSPETIASILDANSDIGNNSGMGIGLKYVLYSLISYYGDAGALHIESSPGHGTTISIRLPAEKQKEGV